MAYSTTNPPHLLTIPPLAGGFVVGSSDAWGGVWGYRSTDAVATVRSSYFTNATDLGMKVGDPVFVYDTGTPNMSLNWVTSITSNVAQLSQVTT
jgi:hypothetical protein